MRSIAEQYQVDTLIHLAALLSAVAEAKPQLAWNLNVTGLVNALEVARIPAEILRQVQSARLVQILKDHTHKILFSVLQPCMG